MIVTVPLLTFTFNVEFVIFVEIPAPHKLIQLFVKNVDTVLGIFTINDGFVTYVLTVLGILTFKYGFTM